MNEVSFLPFFAEFDDKAMLHLTKGLHYVMWMQDKMLWQEQLADNIASLLNLFEREKESVSFIKYMLITISNEWSRIDRWRMDKFLMVNLSLCLDCSKEM